MLLTGEKGGNVRMFDPYYREEAFTEKDLLLVKDHPFCYNRVVPERYFNKETFEIYALRILGGSIPLPPAGCTATAAIRKNDRKGCFFMIQTTVKVSGHIKLHKFRFLISHHLIIK